MSRMEPVADAVVTVVPPDLRRRDHYFARTGADGVARLRFSQDEEGPVQTLYVTAPGCAMEVLSRFDPRTLRGVSVLG